MRSQPGSENGRDNQESENHQADDNELALKEYPPETLPLAYMSGASEKDKAAVPASCMSPKPYRILDSSHP
jgi:hypothetical protein